MSQTLALFFWGSISFYWRFSIFTLTEFTSWNLSLSVQSWIFVRIINANLVTLSFLKVLILNFQLPLLIIRHFIDGSVERLDIFRCLSLILGNFLLYFFKVRLILLLFHWLFKIKEHVLWSFLAFMFCSLIPFEYWIKSKFSRKRISDFLLIFFNFRHYIKLIWYNY